MSMFTKNLASYFGSQLHPLAADAAELSPPFIGIVLLKISRLSTIIVGNDKPTGYPEAENTFPLSEFFLNECGMCQSEISAIFKRKPSLLMKRSIHRAQQAVQLLRDSGCTEAQVRKTITRNPSVITYNADRMLQPKIEFMKTLGLTEQDFGNVISNGSRLLTCSLEKTLSPNIQYLQKLFGPEANVSNLFKSAPHILPKSNGPEFWEKTMKHLASFGLLEDEIKELVRRCPLILNVSTDKVQKNMDFFVHTAGLPSNFLLSCPKFVAFYSLERRIKLRHKVLSAVRAMQPSMRPPSLSYVLQLNERKFLEKYVQCSPYATKLLEIYNGKPALF